MPYRQNKRLSAKHIRPGDPFPVSIRAQYRTGRKCYQAGRINQALQTIKADQGGGVSSKRQGRGSHQKNLGTKSAKPFPFPKSFGSEKIFRKNFGKNKKGVISIGRIFGDSGKNLSGVILLECYYWSDLLGKRFGLG